MGFTSLLLIALSLATDCFAAVIGITFAFLNVNIVEAG